MFKTHTYIQRAPKTDNANRMFATIDILTPHIDKFSQENMM